MKELIARLKERNPDLKPAEILGILHLIQNNQPLTNNDLIRQTGLPKETLKNFKASISQLLSDPVSDTVSFKDVLEYDFPPYKWSLVDYSNPKIEGKLEELRKKHNPEPKRDYDQFFATVKTSVSKAQILLDKGMVENKNIALIGDDDLVSVALGLLTDTFENITVFDIDEEILSAVKEISNGLGIKNVHTVKYDCRQNLLGNFLGKFDIVMTDPPYTKSGVSLFLKRGVELLNNGSNSYVFLCFGNSFKSPEKTLKIQEIINSFNFLIEDKIDKFNRYFGAESIGSASSLYVLKKTPFTYVPKIAFGNAIYTYEPEKEERFPFVDHFVFKVGKVPQIILSSKSALQKVFGEFCRIHRLKVVSSDITRFSKGGFTLNFVLSQSNLTVHTWPEYEALHVVLTTCSPVFEKDAMFETLSRLLGTNSIEIRKVE